MELSFAFPYLSFEPIYGESLERLQVALHGAVSLLEMREPDLKGRFKLDTGSDCVTLFTNVVQWCDAEDLFGAIGQLLNEVTIVTKDFKVSGDIAFPTSKGGSIYRVHGYTEGGKVLELRYRAPEEIISQCSWEK